MKSKVCHLDNIFPSKVISSRVTFNVYMKIIIYIKIVYVFIEYLYIYFDFTGVKKIFVLSVYVT